MVRNHAVTDRNRHFIVKMIWLCQKVINDIIKFVFVTSKNHVTDLFTKILTIVVFTTFVHILFYADTC